MSYKLSIVELILLVNRKVEYILLHLGEKMEIVERIKNLCNTENITIKELERIIQISNGSIRHWNEKTPSVERVLLVADHFNVSLDWLVTGKESGNLTSEEQLLVDHYRRADDRGRRNIMKTEENESSELESSASKLG